MRKLWGWLRRVSATLSWKTWAAIGGVLAVGTLLLAKLTRQSVPNPGSPANPGTTNLITPPAVLAKVEAAEENALRVRIETGVQAEEKQAEVERIATIDDGAERRRRLAELLGRL